MRRVLIPLGVALVAACGPRDSSDAADSNTAAPVPAADSARPDTSLPAASADSAGRKATTPATSASASSADTLRGTVVLTGPAETATPVLQTASGSVALSGPRAAALASLRGLEIWVSGSAGQAPAGTLPRRAIAVDTFSVRAVDGTPAMDGVLRSESGELVLVLSDGSRQTIANPPEGLRQLVGQRVWITRQSGETRRFGTIDSR